MSESSDTRPARRLHSVGTTSVSSTTTASHLMIFVIEVDDFAEMQDLLGDEAAERLESEVERRLRLSLRDLDVVHPLGLGRFVAVCQNPAGSAGEPRWADDLVTAWRGELGRAPRDGELEVVVSITVEVATGTSARREQVPEPAE